jgi:hypothetical protein
MHWPEVLRREKVLLPEPQRIPALAWPRRQNRTPSIKLFLSPARKALAV